MMIDNIQVLVDHSLISNLDIVTILDLRHTKTNAEANLVFLFLTFDALCVQVSYMYAVP